MTTSLTKLRALSEEELARFEPEDLEAYEAELEAAYWGKGRESFRDFVERVEVPGAPIVNEEAGKYFTPKLVPAQHHLLLIDAIQKLADGTYHDVDGVMAFMPPGSAKSTYLSVLGASWLLGRKPGTNVVGASYGQDLANRFGRRVRHIARSPEYSKIMATTITGDNQAVDNWSLEHGSDYRAAGLGGAITGFRADYALIDDPVRGREDADSEIIREKIWQGYNDDISTRLKPGGKIVIAMTRWHEDDLAGRILGELWKGQSGFWKGTDGRLWLVINLPYLAEHKDDPLGRQVGDLLWPEWFRLSEAKRMETAAKKGGTLARTWASLYQQRPAPNEGAILSKGYWKAWEKTELPEVERVYLSYDTAFEEDEESDYSAMTAWGVFEHKSQKKTGEEYVHKHLLLLGAWQDRVSSIELIDTVKAHAKLFHPDIILVEKRASGIQLVQELKRQRLPVKPWLPRGKPGAKGKLPRAHAIAAILEQGSVWYVPGIKTDMVLEQCAAFPYGTHDDLTDTVTCALAYFRDRFIFMSADDELDEDERAERALYLADHRKARRLYGGKSEQSRRVELDPDLERMTSETRRRLYGG